MDYTRIKNIGNDDLYNRLANYRLIIKQYAEITRMTDLPENSNFLHYYRLVIAIKGSGKIVSDGNFNTIKPGYLGYIPPEGRIHVDDGVGLSAIVIAFELSNIELKRDFDKFALKLFEYNVLNDNNGKFKGMMQEIFEECEKETIGFRMVAQNLLQNLFVEVVRERNMGITFSPQNNLSKSNAIYEQALQYINNHLSEPIKINEMADEIGISVNYLYKVFRNKAKVSISEFIMQTKLEFAKSYLENPLIQIKTISTELGFNSPSHFSMVFKLKTGLSPKEYRESKII